MIANSPATEIRPGSMGRPLPGRRGGAAARGADGRALVRDGAVEVVAEPDADGELALRPRLAVDVPRLPARRRALRGVLRRRLVPDRRRRPAGRGRRYFWFVGRADDVIKTAGHLIGPFEVESVLMEHPAVVEAGVIGVPDPVAGEVVKAFVTLRAGHRADRGAAPGAARASPASGSGPPSRPGRSRSTDTCPTPERQDHAPAAQGPRAGPARGRSPSTLEARDRHWHPTVARTAHRASRRIGC